jgi:2-isopropylmalate synthase
LRRITIFDTTLRDGEQSPGIALRPDDKATIALGLERLGVDVIEAGFAVSSPGDHAGVAAVAEAVTRPTVASLARTNKEDIDAAVDALSGARHSRLHIFIATSALHMQRKLQLEPEEVLERTRWAVAYAAEHADEVEFSAEDATRSDPRFLARVCRAAIEAGATTVNLPDTVGYSLPDEYLRFLRNIQRLCPELGAVKLSVHCHDDLGMAVANSLAGVRAGAKQVECTINGLGERAGNASLEEVVMGLRTRPTQFPDLISGVQTEQITAASRLVSYLTGFAVQPNKAIVGGNAFSHESGIHQDGVIKNPLTYEIMTPQSVGLAGSQLTIGKLSGRRGLQGKLRELGHDLEGDALDVIYRQAIALADAKKEVTDQDLLALVEQRASEVPASVELVGWSVTSSHGGNATGSVTLTVRGEDRTAEATGNGPVDALYSAVDAALQPVFGWHPVLTEWEIKAVSAGEDAQGQVLVRCRRSSDEGPGALVVSGHGLSTNIIEASIDGYLVAVNKLHGAEINGVDVAFVGRRTAEDLP